MKIEKINDDKLRIILTSNDLIEKNIDVHSFVSNSIESQKLFWDMLDEAEKQTGFKVQNCQLMIEALAVNGGNFVLTVTKVNSDETASKLKNKRAKVSAKIKNSKLAQSTNIFKFDDFENFIGFCKFIPKSQVADLLESVCLYEYEDSYYLTFKVTSTDADSLIKLASMFSEFATYVADSSLFESKLLEYGTLVCNDNAILNTKKYFK